MYMREDAHAPLYDYLDVTFASMSQQFSAVQKSGESLVKGMQISPHEGKILYHYVMLLNAKRILEIGTFAGYSTLWMASAMNEDGHIDTLEADATHADIAEEHFHASPHKNKITLHRGKALDTLDRLCHESCPAYDIVFIDAAKSEYAAYLEKVTPHVRTGGLVIGDNTLLFGHMIGLPKKSVSKKAQEAMQHFNKTLADSEHFSGIMLPTAEGLTVGIKK
jgi:caffeoyl-CoA O-methyltransferase